MNTRELPPPPPPMVYANVVSFPKPRGRVTSETWQDALQALVKDMDEALRRGDAEAVAFAQDCIAWSRGEGVPISRRKSSKSSAEEFACPGCGRMTLRKPINKVRCNQCRPGAKVAQARKRRGALGKGDMAIYQCRTHTEPIRVVVSEELPGGGAWVRVEATGEYKRVKKTSIRPVEATA